MRKLILVSIIFLALFFNTSCWDKQEIEDRAYITAIGIDTIEGKDTGFSITYEYPNLSAFGKAGEGDPRFTIASEGPTLAEITRQLATRVERDIFFRHLKVVVIGKNVANDQVKLSTILNALDRTPSIGRKTVVLIAEGKAKDVINTEIKENPIIGRFIWDIVQRQDAGGKYYINDIGDLFNNIHRSSMGLIGRVIPAKDQIKLSGSVIINYNKLAGYLDQDDTTSVLILREKIKTDEVTIVRDLGKYIVSYIVKEFKVEKNIKVVDGDIKFTYDIESEGYLEEYLDPKSVTGDIDILDSKKIKEIENQINKEIESKLLKTIHKLQNELGSDVLKIEDYISKKEPQVWKQVEDNWDEEFKKIDFTVNVDSKIRRVGMTK